MVPLEVFTLGSAISSLQTDLITNAGLGIVAGLAVMTVIWGARIAVRLVKSFGK